MKRFVCGFAAGGAAVAAAGIALAALLRSVTASGYDVFAAPVDGGREAIVVTVQEFASLPPHRAGAADRPARMMSLVDEPRIERLFVNDQAGGLYGVGYDGRDVAPYLDMADPRWALQLATDCKDNPGFDELEEACWEGFHSFAFHPSFAVAGTPGFGKFYTLANVKRDGTPADFKAASLAGRGPAKQTLLLAWQARNPGAKAYDGDAPTALMRIASPGHYHAGGQIGFRPGAAAADSDFGLLYMSMGDGGEGRFAQDLGTVFGKFLRIDPLGSNSANGRYGIPADNPFFAEEGALGEVYAYGLRNPHRFAWDDPTGRLFAADVGHVRIEEISQVGAGANLGWNHWEGSYLYGGWHRLVHPYFWIDALSVAWPLVEYDHRDRLLMKSVAVTGIAVCRDCGAHALANQVLFGDLPSGEAFAFPADFAPRRTPFHERAPIRRVLFEDGGETKTLLQMIRARNSARGEAPARRADLRFGADRSGSIYLLNKADGIVRRIVASR